MGSGFDPTEFDLPWTSTNVDPANGEGYGTVYFDLIDFSHQENAICSLHKVFHPQLNALRQSGATSIDLFISWTYDSQCAGSFTAKELQRIADLDCDLSLDCYESHEEDTTDTNEEAEQVGAGDADEAV